MHPQCVSFNTRQVIISWFYFCKNQALRGQAMGSGCTPRPTRYQDPGTHKLPLSPTAYVKTLSWVEGTLQFTCCFPYTLPHLISQPCKIASNSFSTILKGCLVSKSNSNLCKPAVTQSCALPELFSRLTPPDKR